MKTKLKHLSKSTLCVILALMMILSTMLMGSLSTFNAVIKDTKSVGGGIHNYNWHGYVYFVVPDTWNSPASVQLAICRTNNTGATSRSDNYLAFTAMTKITGNLYRCRLNANHGSWNQYESIMFIGGSSAKSDGSYANSSLTYYTQNTQSYGISNDSGYYYATAGESKQNATISMNYTSDGSGLKVDRTVTVQKSTDGSTYSNNSATTTAGKVKQESSYWSTAYTAATSSYDTNISTTKTYSGAVLGAKTTLSVVSTVTNWTFVGWYNGNTLLSSQTSYSYTNKATGTVYARFKQNAAYAITCDGNTQASPTTAHAGDTVTITRKDTSKVFDAVTIMQGSTKITPTSSSSTQVQFTMPAGAVSVSATMRAPKSFTVRAVAEKGGKITTAVKQSVREGSSVTVATQTLDANSYTFQHWYNAATGAQMSTSRSYTFTPSSNITLKAYYADEDNKATSSYDFRLFTHAGGGAYNSGYAKDDNRLLVTGTSNGLVGSNVYAKFTKADIQSNNTWGFYLVGADGSGNYNMDGNYYYDDNRAITAEPYNKVLTVKSNSTTVNSTHHRYSFQFTFNNNTTNNICNLNNLEYVKVYFGTIGGSTGNYYVDKDTIKVEPVFKTKDYYRAYIKDGTLSATQSGTTSKFGTTTVSASGVKLEQKASGGHTTVAYLTQAQVLAKQKLTLTTTVNSAYQSKYYVRGFCVNGVTIAGSINKDKTKTSLTFTYSVPESMINLEGLEITPIYALKESNLIRFYIAGFGEYTVKKDWGNTLAIYPYTSTSGSGSDNGVFSGYPGQPVILENGKYYVDLPKNTVGVTLNNYAQDDVHRTIFMPVGNAHTNNYQTYDYNDFRLIANKTNASGKNPDIIEFKFKYRTTQDNFGSGSHVTSGSNSTSGHTVTSGGFTVNKNADGSFTSTTFKNGFEYLINYWGDKVDIFGNRLTDAQLNNKPAVVVSDGYWKNTSTNTTSENHIGDYSTEWYVWDTNVSGNTITTYSSGAWGHKPSSYFLQSSAPTSNFSGLKGRPVLITYEKSIAGSYGVNYDTSTYGTDKQYAVRSDGRWSYAFADEAKISSKVLIEYKQTLDATTWTTDSFNGSTVTSNEGQVTKCKAYFNNDGYKYYTTSPEETMDLDSNYLLRAQTAGNWQFVGWYVRSGQVGAYTYTKIGQPNDFALDKASPKDGNNTYVARFIPIELGNLSISHSLENEPPSGTTLLKVEVLDGTDVINTVDFTESDVTLDSEYINTSVDYTVRVTLKTLYKPRYDFTSFKWSEITTSGTETERKDITSGKTSGTEGDLNYQQQVRTISVAKLFNASGDQIHTRINYWSLLSYKANDYTVIFKYLPRFAGTDNAPSGINYLTGNYVQYVVKGTLTSDEYEAYADNNFKLTPEFIASKAPYESNFGETFKWKLTASDISYSTDGLTATVSAEQTKTKVTLQYKLKPSTASSTYYLFTYKNSTLLDFALTPDLYNPKNKPTIEAPATFDNKKFDYWNITTDTGEFVAKCYSRRFNYTLFDNYKIEPVYSDNPGSIADLGVKPSIQFLQYSRNQWTDANGNKGAEGAKDFLYADFNVAFNLNGELISPANNKCGIVVAKAKNGSNLANLSTATVTNFIKNGTTNTGYAMSKFQLSNTTELTSKNRIEIWQRFGNKEKNRVPLVVYAYMYDNNGNVQLSDVCNIELKTIGELGYVTTTTSN